MITTSCRRAIGHYEANYMHVSPRNKIDESGKHAGRKRFHRVQSDGGYSRILTAN